MTDVMVVTMVPFVFGILSLLAGLATRGTALRILLCVLGVVMLLASLALLYIIVSMPGGTVGG